MILPGLEPGETRTKTKSLCFLTSQRNYEITLHSRLGSDLEAFSHYPASLALQHWFSNQLHYQLLEPSVPLVLSWITVAMSTHQ
jgi:hypothetical protein